MKNLYRLLALMIRPFLILTSGIRILSFTTILSISAAPLAFSSGLNPVDPNIITDDGVNTPTQHSAAAPNGGTSYNQFNDFNVDSRGLNIENPGANLIINEVVGGDYTSLNGPIAILGSRADLVIANPNGINVNGATFSNIDDLSLITGSYDQANQKFNINPNSGIEIQGGLNSSGGINVSDVNYSNLISRAVLINGNIEAGSKQIKVLTGNNVATKNTISGNWDVDSNSDNSDSSPQFAIDAQEFGAINAGSMYFISTESGVGVRMYVPGVGTPGRLINISQSIDIRSKGDVEYGNLTTSGNVNIEGVNVDGSGAQVEAGNITIKANENFVNGYKLIATNSLTITAKQIQNGVNSSIRVDNGNLTLRGWDDNNLLTLTNNGTMQANSINIDQYVDNIINDFLNQSSPTINILSTGYSRLYNLSIKANNITNGANSVICASKFGNVHISAGNITNNGNIIARPTGNSGDVSSGDVVIDSATSITNNGIIYGKAINIQSDNLINNNEIRATNDDIIINTKYFYNNSGASLFAQNKILVQNGNGGYLEHITNNGSIASMGNIDVYTKEFSHGTDSYSKNFTNDANLLGVFAWIGSAKIHYPESSVPTPPTTPTPDPTPAPDQVPTVSKTDDTIDDNLFLKPVEKIILADTTDKILFNRQNYQQSFVSFKGINSSNIDVAVNYNKRNYQTRLLAYSKPPLLLKKRIVAVNNKQQTVKNYLWSGTSSAVYPDGYRLFSGRMTPLKKLIGART